MSDGRHRVLVADDDPSIQGFLAEALTDEGYEVRTAANGREALTILREWRPDLILLDLMMPEMDGWTFRARQLELDGLAEIPVIVLTAGETARARLQALQAAAVFTKTVDIDVLLASVAAAVQQVDK